MAKKSEHSLFLYTALIFLVAILMIIIAFFGQSNVQKSQPIQSEAAAAASIREKAAALSEENRILLEQNKEYTLKNEELRTTNMALAAENEQIKKNLVNQDQLLAVYDALYHNKKKEARTLLESIVPEELTETQKSFYEILAKKCK